MPAQTVSFSHGIVALALLTLSALAAPVPRPDDIAPGSFSQTITLDQPISIQKNPQQNTQPQVTVNGNPLSSAGSNNQVKGPLAVGGRYLDPWSPNAWISDGHPDARGVQHFIPIHHSGVDSRGKVDLHSPYVQVERGPNGLWRPIMSADTSVPHAPIVLGDAFINTRIPGTGPRA